MFKTHQATPDCYQQSKGGVIFLTMSMGCGGAERVISRLSEYFSSKAHSVIIVSLNDNIDDFFELGKDVQRVRLQRCKSRRRMFGKIRAYSSLMTQLRTTLKKNQCAVLISFLPVANIIGIMASIGAPWRTVICERNNPYKQQDLNRPWRLMRRLLYPLADLITVNSLEAKRYCKHAFRKRKVIELRNPIVLDKRELNPSNKKVMLFVGRLAHQKGVDILLQSLHLVNEQLGDWKLHIVGEGSEKPALQQKAKALQVDDKVVWKLPTNNVFEEYAHAAFLVLPSRFEGTSNVMLEAVSIGLPVITSRSGAGKYVEDGINGEVIEELSASNLAAALNRMIRDESWRERIYANCQAVHNDTNPEEIFREWSTAIGLPG